MTKHPSDYVERFSECGDFRSANQLHKELVVKSGFATDVILASQEAHRLRLIELSGLQPVSTDAAAKPTNEDGVRNKQVRNWAAKQGIPLARKGKVPVDIVNQYREAHGLPVVETTKVHVTQDDVAASPAEVRAWARAHDIEVGQRGRIHPDILAQYVNREVA